MKNILSKISSLAFVTVFVMGMMMFAHTASAGYAFNTRPEDCDTTNVINKTTNEGFSIPCWNGTSVTVRPGEEFNVKVYFRNTGDAAANNVAVRMTNAAGATIPAGSTKQYSGHILVGGSYAAGENVSVYFPSAVRIELVKIEFQTNTTGITDISGDSALFSSSGRQIAGTMPASLDHWGTIKAAYRAVAVQTGSAPTIQNQQVSNVGTSSATINGTYSSNYSATKACFDVKYPNGDVVKRDANLPAGTTGNFSLNLSGLSAGTYYYQACGANVYGSASASGWESFVINNIQPPTYQCNDGVDNDGDGRIDLNDFGCDSSTDNDETNAPPVYYQCNDGVDNDSDGKTDYPADPGCTSSTDNTESPNPSVVNQISVATGSPSVNNGNGSVKLQGNFYNNDGYVSTTYFIWRPINGSERATPSAGSYSNASHGFSYVQTGFANGTYEYRACANNGDVVCGEWVRFIIEKGTPPPISSDPTAQTLTPVSIGYTTAVIDGFYNMNGCSGRTYFEYGTSASSLGQATGSVARSTSGSMAQALTDLTPGVTYYYRAVVENCNGTVKGNTYSFSTARKGTTTVKSTTSTGIVRTTVVREVTVPVANTVVTGAVGGARYVRLTIDNSRDTVARNEELVYDVAWENISNVDIKDLVLEITFPKALQITSTDRGQIDRDANAVYVNIDELRISEKDDITIRTKVVGNLKENDPVTARAIIAFENPENRQAQENAIAYDSDTFVASQNQVLGASIFGLGNLPGTLAGWLFLILLLILIILVIRYMTRREEHHHYYTNREDIPVTPKNVVTHEEVDYTPYRPTPKE